jgi:predicted transport protein
MDLYKIKKNTLEPIERESFKLEKNIQSLVENNIETLFNLEFISTEFSVGDFRLDSLCYDNVTNSFVVIEYKKGSSYSVIDQGYSYMSIMLNNKSDFILEYIEKTGKSLKKSEVDFSQSRILFISQSFNSYQKNSVNFKDVPFELWEIKKFSNNTISLNQHLSSSKESIQKIEGNKNSVIKNVGKEIKLYNEEHFTNNLSENTLNLWNQLKEKLLEFEDINFNYTKYYIGFEYNKTKVCGINFKKNKLDISIHRGAISKDNKKSKNFFVLDDPKGVSEDFSWTWKSGTKGHEYWMKYDEKTNLDYLLFLIKQKYDSLIN